MTKSKRALVIGICVLAALASAQLLRSRGPRNTEPFLAEVPMSDGIHRLRLLKIVEGPMVYDWKDPTPPLLRMLPLPSKLRPPHVPFAKIKTDGVLRGFGMTGEQVPAINFLFRVVDSKGEYAAYPLGLPELTLIESTGHRFEKLFGQFDHDVWGCVNFQRGVVPRRDRMLKMEVQFKNSGKQSLVFEVENPFYAPPAQEWVPEPLPATKQFGGVDVTLLWPGSASLGGHMVNVDLRTKNHAMRPEYSSYWIEDATGNRGPGLSPFEPAWKLHGKLSPQSIEAIPPDRIWTVDDVAVPPYGIETPLNLEHEIDGVKLRLGTIIGGAPGSGEKNNKTDGPLKTDGSGVREDAPRFDVTANSSHSKFEVVVRVSYNGEVIMRSSGGGRTPFTREIKSVFKKLPADSKVKIDIGVARPIDMEFLVSPKDFGSGMDRIRREKEAAKG